ncbi:MAG: HAMP domain-containing histidine kinase [Marinobacterium sp.]|nr:HAMP domain-containing histidine kinase [Marinobacterium sp.]
MKSLLNRLFFQKPLVRRLFSGKWLSQWPSLPGPFRRLRSLFWKIFLAIWLSSLVVMGVSLALFSQMSERDRLNDWLLDSVRLNAEQLVDEYERQDGLSERRQRYYSHRFERGFFKRWERSDRRWKYDHDKGDWRDKGDGHDKGDWHDRGDRRHDEYDRKTERHREHAGTFSVLPDEMRKRLMPRIRIYDEQCDKQIFGGPPRPKREQKPHTLNITSQSGHVYRVEVAMLEQRSPLRYMLGMILSYQVVVILLGSALASVLLSWLIIRPLNQLRVHTRDIHQGDLGSRAGQKLSRRRDELGDLAREFNQMADYVEQTLMSGQRLLQDVSHELRAPLARLQVASGLAEQKLGEGDRLAVRINQECEQLNRLIDEILTLSRLDAQPLDSESWELAELLRELADDIRFTAPQRVLHWPEVLTDEEACIARLPGNRALVQRALNNILSNVLRHTPSDAAIWLQADSHPRQPGGQRQLTLVLRDNGPGVDEALLPMLLEPFVRAEENKSEGYGLGLSIARRAVERLGGRISLRNHPDGGLEVTLVLPLSASSPAT